MAAVKYYNVSEVAEILSLSGKTVRTYIKDGRLKAVMVGNRWKIAETEVKKILKGSYSAPPQNPVPVRPKKKEADTNECF